MKNCHYEIPLTLSRELSQNNNALQNYSVMTARQKNSVNQKIEHCIYDAEISRIVQNIADGQFD